MIFNDRVAIVCKTKETSSGPVIEKFNGNVPAIVVPMSSADVITSSGASISTTRYQFLLKPFSYVIPLNATDSAPSAAGSNQILFTWGGSSTFILEGKIERHLFRGRLHHYEFIARR